MEEELLHEESSYNMGKDQDEATQESGEGPMK